MSRNYIDEPVFSCACIVVALVGFALGAKIGVSKVRSNAQKADAGQWEQVEPGSNRTEWIWTGAETKEQKR